MDSGPLIACLPGNNLGTFSKNVRGEVWESWLNFCYNSRMHEGDYMKLTTPSSGIACQCGRSTESYPHWPPSTLLEAFDMLGLQIDDDNSHHRYLAGLWRDYVNVTGFHTSTMDIDGSLRRSSHYLDLSQEIFELCPTISKDMKKVCGEKNEFESWVCETYCQVVIDLGDGQGCLCFCDLHQRECPSHGEGTFDSHELLYRQK